MVEHYVRDVGAAGSNPVTSTKNPAGKWLKAAFSADFSIPEVEKLSRIYSVQEIKEALFSIFDANPMIYSAVLFGSYAKGEATEQSDVDIVIDSRGQLLNINFYGVLDEITERLGKKVDLLELSEIKKPSDIYTKIQRGGITIYERQG